MMTETPILRDKSPSLLSILPLVDCKVEAEKKAKL